MPEQVFQYVFTCPASTPTTAPVEAQLAGMDPLIPRKITVTIPDGHAGLTGIALAYGHNPVIPSNSGAFITGNDHTFPFELTNYPNGVAWSVFMCNLDSQGHSWQVVFEGDGLPDMGAGAVSAPINTGALAQLQAGANTGL